MTVHGQSNVDAAWYGLPGDLRDHIVIIAINMVHSDNPRLRP